MKWSNVAITSTVTRASDGVAERRGSMTAILRGREGVNQFRLKKSVLEYMMLAHSLTIPLPLGDLRLLMVESDHP